MINTTSLVANIDKLNENHYYFSKPIKFINIASLITNFNDIETNLETRLLANNYDNTTIKNINEKITNYKINLQKIEKNLDKNIEIGSSNMISFIDNYNVTKIIDYVINSINPLINKKFVIEFINSLPTKEEVLEADSDLTNLPIAIYWQKTNITNVFNIVFPNNFKISITIHQ